MFNFLISPIYAATIFGTINNPTAYSSSNGQGLFTLLSNLFKLAAAAGAIFVVFQIISAGFMYISAAGDPKKFEAAWNKIWQAMLGLIIIAVAFTIAAVIGKITGIDPLNPKIYGP